MFDDDPNYLLVGKHALYVQVYPARWYYPIKSNIIYDWAFLEGVIIYTVTSYVYCKITRDTLIGDLHFGDSAYSILTLLAYIVVDAF